MGFWQVKASNSTSPASYPTRTRLASHHERVPESYLGYRYYVHSPTSWLDVPGGDLRLVLSLCRQLGTRSDPGNVLCPHRDAARAHTSGSRDLLLETNVQISMDGKGRALDNIFTERLWRTVKYEEVYVHDYVSPRQARQQLKKYLEFYNQQRVHQALSYRTPAEVYFQGGTAGAATSNIRPEENELVKEEHFERHTFYPTSGF
jgi:Integrase core domain